MSRFLVSYDLKSTPRDPHGPFLRHAERLGWSRWVKMQVGPPRKLPNTTLVGDFPTIEAATAAFDQAITATALEIHWPVTATKRYVLPHEESGKLISNESKADDVSELVNAILRMK